MPKNRKNNSTGTIVTRILFALACFAVVIGVLLYGNNIALVHTKGFIANEQLRLMIVTLGILLALAIPVVWFAYHTAWKYRESNTKAVHTPDASHGKWLVAGIWLVPTAFAVILSLIMWPATHKLEPHAAIASDTKPITIQVISTQWKWIFIYPEQNIATVNFVQIPVDTPVEFLLTADEAPMSSFWIPNLGGMLYTMTGHLNQLNLVADTPGDYRGSSAEINGSGFAGMKFTARAGTHQEFDAWVQKVKQSPTALTVESYKELLKPSENNPVAFYSATPQGLYDTVLTKYMGPSGSHGHSVKTEKQHE
jgi:cytochrome o ubiquinol oxidase subunit 2